MDVNRQEKFEHWADKARYDLDTAQAMLNARRYLYVAFMCQQAIEKLVKGLYVLHLDKEPPRTHNIYTILVSVFENNAETLEQVSRYAPFFAELSAYYISERYPSYRERMSSALTPDKAKEVLRTATEVYEWLQSLRT
jgi:HEPN domain-containing protein